MPIDAYSGTSSLLAAVRWLESLLLGSIAVAIATLAVAGFGFLVMAGRVNVRTGAQIILGCFVLFGARTIALGLQSSVAAEGAPAPATAFAPSASPLPVSARPGAPANNDPFAGASVPTGSGSCCN
ncbi:MAG TPA: TrbC/VirB2 family protein [Allosphingosinicella sp.]|jgi:type IV secretory pathway VirB2 component (pilin)